jgi:predicted ATPase
VGKTRLLAELGTGHRVLVGRCYPVREAFPLGPVVEALRGVPGGWQRPLGPLAGSLRALLPELADALPPPPEPLGDPLAERYRLFRGALDVLGAVGRVVVALEDTHWADESTCDLVTLLLQALPPELTLVLTYRAHDLEPAAPLRRVLARVPPGTTRIDLKPLDAPAVAALTGALLAADRVSEQFAQLVWERTGGVPFAVEEVLRLLRGRKDLVQREGRWMRRTLDELAVPAAIRDTVLERLGRFGADARAVVEAAAVWGGAISDVDLPDLCGLEPSATAAALSEAVVSAMLRDDDGRTDFRHALARQAVYDGIPGPSRRALHARSAALLERRDPAAITRLAHHHRLAGHLEEWVRYAEAAGNRLAASGDVLSAAAFVEEAAATADIELSTRARLAFKLAA